jgi:hypothetical protein
MTLAEDDLTRRLRYEMIFPTWRRDEAAEVFLRNVMIRSLDREAIALLKAG